MVMNRTTFRNQLQEGLNTVFGLAYRRYEQEWTALYETSNSVKAYEEDLKLAGLGAAPVKPEGAPVTYDAGGEAYKARYTHETIALAFSITEESVEDGLYGDLGAKYARALATSMVHTKEVKGADVYNKAFDSGYTGGDGKELLATDHPLWGGGTLSNELSTPADLSEAALEDACIQVSQWTDERGIPIHVRIRKLIVPSNLEFVVQRLLMSPMRPGTADNDINVINKGGYFPDGYAVNHRFTDPDAWFGKTDADSGMRHFRRRRLRRGVEGDFETGNMRYKTTERYSFGWTDPRGLFGSAGAS